MVSAFRLIVGAYGWDYDAWSGDFYPDDLPVEWRLSYYANEFNGVLVPEPVWRVAGAKQITRWCGDVADGFLFYLESPLASLSDHPLYFYRDLFGTHWGGIADADSVVMQNEREWDLRQIRDRLQNLIRDVRSETTPALFIFGDPPNIDHLREARLLADML